MMHKSDKTVEPRGKEARRATYAEIVRFVILACAFATLAFVLVGHDVLIFGMVVAIGVLLLVLSEAWRLPHRRKIL